MFDHGRASASQSARVVPRSTKMRLEAAPVLAGRVRLGDAAHEQFHGVVADGALVAADGGQRHGHVDLGLYVVKADDGHILRHAHAALGEGATAPARRRNPKKRTRR